MKRFISLWIIISFIASSVMSPQQSFAQGLLDLPEPGAMVSLSPVYVPLLVKGLKVHPENPLLFDFILDSGNSGFKVNSPEFKVESQKLIKYFLASLTIKEDDWWVNLSPYEKDRIVPDDLGETELGQDMLAQDYILKQLTASLIYPEKRLGKEFWSRVYAKARQMYGTSQVPVNTFNKVWIIADKAKVLERNNAAFIIGAHLKVMLEEDYLSLQKHDTLPPLALRDDTHSIGANIIRQIILPELEKEVNQGQNFAPLRQMFYSMILASWYKLAIKNALLNQVYSNKGKIGGVLSDEPAVKEEIYEQYLKAYKKGVFNYIKEDINAANQQSIPRKYFSGGLSIKLKGRLEREKKATPEELISMRGNFAMVGVDMTEKTQGIKSSSAAMVGFIKRALKIGFKELKSGEMVDPKEVDDVKGSLGGIWNRRYVPHEDGQEILHNLLMMANDETPWNDALKLLAIKRSIGRPGTLPIFRMKRNPLISNFGRLIDDRWEMTPAQKAIIKLAIQGSYGGYYIGSVLKDGSDKVQTINNLLHVMEYKDPFEYEKIDDLLILGNDNFDVFRGALRLFAKGYGKRIVILGGFGRLTPPLIDAVEKSQKGKKGGFVLPNDGKGLSESGIIRIIMQQMVEKEREFFWLRRKLNPKTYDQIFVLEERSTNTPENLKNYKDMLTYPQGGTHNILFLQGPEMQLRSKATLGQVFNEEIKAGKIKDFSYPVHYDIYAKPMEQVIKTMVSEAWKLIVYSDHGKRDISFSHTTYGNVDLIPEEFWVQAYSLFMEMGNTEKRELARYLIGIAAPGFSTQRVSGSTNSQLKRFVASVFDAAMIEPSSRQRLTNALEGFYGKIKIDIPGYVPQRPFYKAIRDHILEIIMKNSDEVPVWMKLDIDQDSWEQFLVAKIFEEFIEFQQTIAEKGQSAKEATLIEEASDILEIIDGMNSRQKWFEGDFESYLRQTAQNISNESSSEEQLIRQITDDIVAISKADNPSRKEKVESLIVHLIQFSRANQVDFEEILAAKKKKKEKIGGFERNLFYIGKFYDQEGWKAFQSIGQAVDGNPYARKVSIASNGGAAKEVEVFTGRMKPDDFTADASFDMDGYLRDFPVDRIQKMLPGMLGNNMDQFFRILSGKKREDAIVKIIEMIREQSTRSPVMLAGGDEGTQEILLDRQQMKVTTDGQANFINLLELLFKAHSGVTRDFVMKDIFAKADIIATILRDFGSGELLNHEQLTQIGLKAENVNTIFLKYLNTFTLFSNYPGGFTVDVRDVAAGIDSRGVLVTLTQNNRESEPVLPNYIRNSFKAIISLFPHGVTLKPFKKGSHVVQFLLRDRAMGAAAHQPLNGGIDLNARNMGLNVIKEGQGIEMRFDPAMLARFQRGDFSGIVAVIIRITPISSVFPVLGLPTS